MREPTPEAVKQIFDRYFPANVRIWESFAEKLKTIAYARNEIIKPCNGKENHLNLLIKGSVALYVCGEDTETCIHLCYENDIFSDYLSFLRGTGTPIQSVALEETVVWAIHKNDLQELYTRSTAGVHIGKAIAEVLYIRKQTEQIKLLTLSPQERYLQLLQEKPEVLQRTPLKIVASFLGLTAESVSRIRKRIGK
ncbi:cAMP-binding domain of CRP or a regulatory subunit of cAMP-dependent protein kinases [Filimonas lacunae]|uniref:cAMP-binding domain of CRP or a regulatory subunit of cAMP-dependent protein kinases n=1 Tax=Filimonas lacunae TaxID=477680 RepID=A0A173MHY0_9BACT|nr:cyclic nucleotide-binding domain-containing protein [Filimonas lacunae]BAV07100.1 Crp/Fnr family transcriptional regulator [Filimonas lacunae]SIS94988.1 cAMP-binding domain of CRP or a regulatory subunit of cAMP-dependent protein kinases [Filimonas lacunae]